MNRKEKHIELTEMGQLTLGQGLEYHPKPEFREKYQRLLLNHVGMSLKKIAPLFKVNHNTVSNWVKAWERSGISGLSKKNGQGRKLILNLNNSVHRQWIDQSIDLHHQNVKTIQAELEKKLDRPMSSDTVKRFLKKIFMAAHPTLSPSRLQ